MTAFETLLTARLKQLKSRKNTMDIYLKNQKFNPERKSEYTEDDIKKLNHEIEETKVALKAVSEFNKQPIKP